MVSKIIQKEKERQETFLIRAKEGYDNAELFLFPHKQSLINLKEYLSNLIIKLKLSTTTCKNKKVGIVVKQLYRDIKELEEIIGRYE